MKYFFLEINFTHLSTMENERQEGGEHLVIPLILTPKTTLPAFSICSSANTSRSWINFTLADKSSQKKGWCQMWANCVLQWKSTTIGRRCKAWFWFYHSIILIRLGLFFINSIETIIPLTTDHSCHSQKTGYVWKQLESCNVVCSFCCA